MNQLYTFHNYAACKPMLRAMQDWLWTMNERSATRDSVIGYILITLCIFWALGSTRICWLAGAPISKEVTTKVVHTYSTGEKLKNLEASNSFIIVSNCGEVGEGLW
jgi:hypothetical protein